MTLRLPVLVLALGCSLALALEPEDSPAPIENVDARDLRDLGVRTTEDLLKLIPTAPLIIPRCATVGRGLICIDEADAPRGGYEFLPGDLIDRVEVLRGPQGAIYGSDPSAGVLRIAGDKKKWCSYGSGASASIGNLLGSPGDEEDGEGYEEDDEEISPMGRALRQYIRDVEAAGRGDCVGNNETPRDFAGQQAPTVAGTPAQREALDRQWTDLATQQEAMERTRDALEGQLDKAKDAEDAAEIARLEKALADLTLSQDAVSEAANAVGDELNALEQAEATRKDDLRSELWQKIHQAANPKIEERIATAEGVQAVKEGVTGVTKWISTGSTVQQETARGTRMGNREKIAAEEKIAAIDTLLADPATTDEQRALLGQMRATLVHQLDAANEILSSNGWITTAGYGIDVGTTICGAKIAQLGKNFVARLFAKEVAKNTTEHVVVQAVAREAGESGSTTAVTQVMQRPPIDYQKLGDSAMRKAVQEVEELADKKYGGNFMNALDETLDNILGTDILPAPKTAASEAARESLDAGWKAARAATQQTGARAAGETGGQAAAQGGTTILKDAWEGFAQRQVDPNGMTTLFGVAPFAIFFGWQQQGYAAEPIYGEKGSDGVFTFPNVTTIPGQGKPYVVDFTPLPPLDSIVLWPVGSASPTAPVRDVVFQGKRFFFLPNQDVSNLFPGGNATTNLCRDKQLVPLIDWSDPGATLPGSYQGGAIPSSAVRLPR